MALSPQYVDIESRLTEPLADLVAARRAEGVSWRRIAIEVTTRTGVDITGETLRVWHQGREPMVRIPTARGAAA